MTDTTVNEQLDRQQQDRLNAGNDLAARLDAIWRDLDKARVVVGGNAGDHFFDPPGQHAVRMKVEGAQELLRDAIGLVLGVRDGLSSHRKLANSF